MPHEQVESQRDGQDGQVFSKKLSPSYKEKKKNFKKNFEIFVATLKKLK
jgi:hypothetical protein